MAANEFLNGPFCNRILKSLRDCDYETLAELKKEKKIKHSDTLLLSNKVLRMDEIECYSDSSGCSLRYFFYGNDRVETTYTVNDLFVQRVLNLLSDDALSKLLFYIKSFFENDKYNCTIERVSYRLTYLMKYITEVPSESAIASQEAMGKKFTPDEKELLIADFERYNKVHRSVNFCFNSEASIAWATFLGVSVHWIYHLKKPLYCTSELAEQIFDCYTLMSKEQQDMFVMLLKEILSKLADSLPKG